jgi:hypothetical protein
MALSRPANSGEPCCAIPVVAQINKNSAKRRIFFSACRTEQIPG